jgi:uroporphyrinogen-III synthase
LSSPKTILITRSLKPDSPLRKYAVSKQFHLLEKSFIKTHSISDLKIPETTWIFFSSPRGAELYFESYPLRATYIASLSNGTAKAVEKAGFQSQFVGDSRKTTPQIGYDFFNRIQATDSVLFPISSISKKSISSIEKSDRIHEIVSYETVLIGEKLTVQPDTVVFTSPSNVDGYLLSNAIHRSQEIIAIGQTTADHLNGLGYANIQISETPLEESICKLIR